MNELMNGNAIKMTSIEIAELVGKRHDNVKRTIETLAKNGVIRLPQIEVSERINNLGFNVQYEHYVFEGEQGKRDSIVVVAQLSPELTAGESLKKLRLISPKRYRKRCALLPILLSRKCNWKTSSQLSHLKLSLPIALARPAEF